MIFILIILILTPGLISLNIHRKFIGSKTKAFESITTYSIYTFSILSFVYLISYIYNPKYNINFSINNGSDLYRVSFILKYMLLALIGSVILPALLYLIKNIFWFIKKLLFLKTKNQFNFFNKDNSKQINEYIFGNADFYLNLSVKEIQKLVFFINNILFQKGKLYLISPEINLLIKHNQLEIEKISSENINNLLLTENDALLLIDDQIQESHLGDIKTIFHSRVFRLTFDDDNKIFEKGNSLFLSEHFNEMNVNTKYIQELVLQSLLGFVLTLVQ